MPPRDDIHPVARILAFRQAGQTPRDVPVENRLSLARAHLGYRNMHPARALADSLIDDRAAGFEAVDLAAGLAIQFRDYARALELLDSFPAHGLSAGAARQLAVHRATALRGMGDIEGGIAACRAALMLAPQSVDTTLRLIDALMLQAADAEIDALFARLLSRGQVAPGIAYRYLDYLFERNYPDQSSAWLGRFERVYGADPEILWRACRAAWYTGQEARFSSLCARLVAVLDQTGALPQPAIGFFFGLAGFRAWPKLGELRDAVLAQLRRDAAQVSSGQIGTAPKVVDWALPRLAASVRTEDAALIATFATFLDDTFGILPRAKTVLASAALAENDYARAWDMAQAALALDPFDPEIHATLFDIELHRSGDVQALQDILDHRDRMTDFFTQRHSDGRTRFFDRDRYPLLKRQGNFVAAYSLHNNQPPNRELARMFPHSYLPLEVPLFGEGNRGERLAIIGHDGVGDEVRWARFYDQVRDRFDHVTLSCDPRLATIFARSYPEYDVIPIKRRAPNRCWTETDKRGTIRQVNLASKLDAAYVHRLAQADRIVFPEEIAVQFWAHKGRIGPGPDNAEINHSYLVPDPKLAADWSARLDAAAQGRPKVGLVWRSLLRSTARNRHFLELADFEGLAGDDVFCVSLQAAVDDEEMALADRLGIAVYPEADLYDDFETMLALSASVDVVVGIASTITEMAASTGVAHYLTAPAPFGRFIRAGAQQDTCARDLNTPNSLVFSVVESDQALGKPAIVAKIMDEVRAQIATRRGLARGGDFRTAFRPRVGD